MTEHSRDAFDLEELNAHLAGTPFVDRLHYYPTISSTNGIAMQEAIAGAPEFSVYFADEQTTGRGRGAHEWHSAAGSGLYVSVLLRPRIAPADVLWLSLAAGLAVHKAVQIVTTLEADLRWPNDLLFGRKKFCGILTELSAEFTAVRHAVVGIGINVHHERFPEELAGSATSLRIETGHSWSRQELLTALLTALHAEEIALSASIPDAAASIRRRLEGASSWVKGRHVTVEEGEGFAGVTAGLDPRGFLLVKTADSMRTVVSGGVREYESRTPRTATIPSSA